MTTQLRRATLEALREQMANLQCEPTQRTILDLSNVVEQLVEIVDSLNNDVNPTT